MSWPSNLAPNRMFLVAKKEVDPKVMTRMLGMAGAPASPMSAQNQSQPSYRFILPLSECQFTLESIIESFVPTSWPPKKACRPVRSTGAALSIAVSLLENLRLNCAARIMCFLGGPATHGPGMVVEPPLKNPMRAHFDLEKDNAKYSKEAYKFYDKQAQRACKNGHIVDILAGSLDQVGTMEMRQLVQKTGGYLVNAESFEHQMFKESFRKMFQRDGNGNLNMGFDVTCEVQMSKEMKVMGAIGHLVSANKKSPSVSTKTVGESGTNSWKICGIDPQTTFGFYFSVVNQDQMPKRNQRGLIQFTTSYMDSSGASILRVTTLGRPFVTGGVPGQQQEGMMVDPNPKNALSAGFDQEAAAVLMARMAVFKTREESPFDVIRWLDRTLISVTQQFGEYIKGDATSFRLGRAFGLLPQFMFHLRRSCLLQNFNSSPDESTYYRFMLLRETCPNSMTMIQPRLEAYTMQDKGFPVLLSSKSLAPDRILMLDTFFHLVIWHGKTISDWMQKGFQNDPNYGAFRALLEAPQEDAKYVMEDRIPTPMFKSCPHNHGDARYLLAVVDPTNSTGGGVGGSAGMMGGGGGGGEVIPTDDANLQVFVDHLAKLTVQKK
mmetsp:Transcript_33737/g.52760  ORF Transcript_33737/g.52760 Transcript_33737/m.52760 type:complete len:606 (-) Transcript_33737:175-1992(-)